MPGNAFIKFMKGSTAAQGESQQIGHHGDQGWIEISDWGWDVEAEASHLKGTGASVGKPQPGVLNFTHYYDKSSPTIMEHIVKGTHFDTATLDMLKQTGKDQPEVYFQLIAKDVFITKVSSKGNEDGSVSQDIEFVFKGVAIGYRPQKNDGTLDMQKTMFFRWNIAEMSDTVPGTDLFKK